MTDNREPFQQTDISNKATIYPVNFCQLLKRHINFSIKTGLDVCVNREAVPFQQMKNRVFLDKNIDAL